MIAGDFPFGEIERIVVAAEVIRQSAPASAPGGITVGGAYGFTSATKYTAGGGPGDVLNQSRERLLTVRLVVVIAIGEAVETERKLLAVIRAPAVIQAQRDGVVALVFVRHQIVDAISDLAGHAGNARRRPERRRAVGWNPKSCSRGRLCRYCCG